MVLGACSTRWGARVSRSASRIAVTVPSPPPSGPRSRPIAFRHGQTGDGDELEAGVAQARQQAIGGRPIGGRDDEDRIAAHQQAEVLGTEVPRAACVEVTGSHVGLVFNRKSYRAIAEALAAPELMG